VADIIKCKSCGEKVSKNAQSCPHCGEPFPGLIKYCPNCGSASFSAGVKGYGVGTGVAGAVVFGPLGLAAGAIGRKKVELTCLECDYRWTPKNLENDDMSIYLMRIEVPSVVESDSKIKIKAVIRNDGDVKSTGIVKFTEGKWEEEVKTSQLYPGQSETVSVYWPSGSIRKTRICAKCGGGEDCKDVIVQIEPEIKRGLFKRKKG